MNGFPPYLKERLSSSGRETKQQIFAFKRERADNECKFPRMSAQGGGWVYTPLERSPGPSNVKWVAEKKCYEVGCCELSIATKRSLTA